VGAVAAGIASIDHFLTRARRVAMHIDLGFLAYPAVVWISITSLMVLISRSWRFTIIPLALQYLGVFVLVTLPWPFEMAVAKLVAGWMASAVLGIAASESTLDSPDSRSDAERSWPSGWLFRTLAASLVWLTVFSLAPKTVSWIPGVGLAQAWGGLLLIGMGLLNLGLTAQPLRVITGLLTALSGFEILYAAVVTSALLAGLLAASQMGLAIVGAYLIVAPFMGEGGE
jgi:hypothetical protein